MTKQEYLAASLPYGLYIDDGKCSLYMYKGEYFDRDLEDNFKNIIPIVRPLSDLTKKIVQADYNGGKPFVPLTELLKNNGFNTNIMSMEEQREYIAAITHDMTISDALLCIKWHFDLIEEDCEKVYVSENFNPYK